MKKARPEMSNKQRTAIVLNEARKSAKKAGKPSKAPKGRKSK